MSTSDQQAKAGTSSPATAIDEEDAVAELDIEAAEREKLQPQRALPTLAATEAGRGLDTVARTKRQSLLLKRGDTDLSIDRTGLQRLLPRCMQFAFADTDAELLYREYYQAEKRSDFRVLVIVLVIVSCVLLVLFASSFTAAKAAQMAAIVVSLVAALAAAGVGSREATSPHIWALLPFCCWAVELAHVVCDLWLFEARPRLPSDALAWLLVYSYSIYVIFPLRVRFCCLLAALMAAVHLSLVTCSPTSDATFKEQVNTSHHHSSPGSRAFPFRRAFSHFCCVLLSSATRRRVESFSPPQISLIATGAVYILDWHTATRH